MFRNRNKFIIQKLIEMHNQNEISTQEIKNEMVELKKSNVQLAEELASFRPNKKNHGGKTFSNDSNY